MATHGKVSIESIRKEHNELAAQVKELNRKQLNLREALERAEQEHENNRYRNLIGKFITQIDDEDGEMYQEEFCYITDFNEEEMTLCGISVTFYPDCKNILDTFLVPVDDVEYLLEYKECSRAVFQEKYLKVLNDFEAQFYKSRIVLFEKHKL